MTAGTATVAQGTLAKAGNIFRAMGKGPWALADQMLISASNFITILLLARGFSPSDLGRFTIVYSVLLFLGSIQTGLITQPHNIFGATAQGEDYRRYTSGTALSQVGLALAGAFLATLVWGAAWTMHAQVAPLLLALIPSIVAWQFQEFVRRVLYTENRLGAAFFNDLLSYGGQAVLLGVLQLRGQLTGPLALYVLAATSAAATVLGLWQIRGSLAFGIDRSAFRENWHFGKWIAGGEVVGHWLSAQLLVYLAAAMLGAAAAGVLRAVHTLFGPSRVLTDALTTVLPIRFSRTLSTRGERAMNRQVRSALLLSLPALAIYCLLVAGFAGPLLRLLYGQKYAGQGRVLALYSLATFISYVAMLLASVLRSRRMTRQVFMAQVWSSVVALPAGWLLSHWLLLPGTVLGMIASYVVMSLLLSSASGRRADPANSAADGECDDQAGADPEDPPIPHLLKSLDEEGIRWCLLHPYGQRARRGWADVDLLVDRRSLHRIATLMYESAQRLGWRVVQLARVNGLYMVLARQSPGGRPDFLQLDFNWDVSVRHRRLYVASEVLSLRRTTEQGWAPPPSIDFVSSLARKLGRGRWSPAIEQRLQALHFQDPDGCQRELRRWFSQAEAEFISHAAACGDWSGVLERADSLRRRLLSRAALKRPLAFAANWIDWQRSRLARWLRPTHGLSLAVFGPDGAGKSSLIRLLSQRLAPAFFQVDQRSFPPAVLDRDGPEQLPHERPARGWLHSSLRALLYWLPYYRLVDAARRHAARARGALVLYDRHPLDTLVDPRRYRYGGPQRLLRWLGRLLPGTDLLVALDAPAEVIQRRKQEVPLAETRRQLDGYLRLVCTRRNGYLVDAEAEPDQVGSAVSELVIDVLAQRVERRLGVPVAPLPEGALRAALQRWQPAVSVSQWRIRRLGAGKQAEAFLVRRRDGREICPDRRHVVIKVFFANLPNVDAVLRDSIDCMRALQRAAHGRAFHGWHVQVPEPLAMIARPAAIVMSTAPGRQLNRCLHQFEPATTGSIAAALQAAFECFWLSSGRSFGDCGLENILCAPGRRMLSLVDAGLPSTQFLCSRVPRDEFPASRDLAYLLFDVASAVRAGFVHPRQRRAQLSLVEAVLRQHVADTPAHRREPLLEEIHACAHYHVDRIFVSWTPAGLFRVWVRLRTRWQIDQTLEALGAARAEAGAALPAEASQ